jgi:hypothetical protein
MDERLLAAGRSIRLRHTVNRWLEYSLLFGFFTVVLYYLAKWQGWTYMPVIFLLIVSVCFLGVACVYNLRLIDSMRHQSALQRAHREQSESR